MEATNETKAPVMEAKIENDKLIIEMELQTPKISSTGRSKIITKGNVKIPFGDKTMTVQVNGFIPTKQYV